MLLKIAVDMSIDIGHRPQEERGARVGIDQEAEAKINVEIIDPDVK